MWSGQGIEGLLALGLGPKMNKSLVPLNDAYHTLPVLSLVSEAYMLHFYHTFAQIEGLDVVWSSNRRLISPRTGAQNEQVFSSVERRIPHPPGAIPGV